MEKKRKRNRPAGSTQVERCRKVRGNVFFPPWQWAQESAGWPALLRRGPPGRKFPHVRRTLRETCTQPPPPPLPPASKVRRGERLRGVCRLCSIPDVPGRVGTLLRPVGRKSAALQPLVSGCFGFFCLCLTRKCRSVIVLMDCSLFFSSLVFRSSRVATDPNQMEAGQTAAAKTRPSSRCVRAAPTLVFPRLSRSPF